MLDFLEKWRCHLQLNSFFFGDWNRENCKKTPQNWQKIRILSWQGVLPVRHQLDKVSTLSIQVASVPTAVDKTDSKKQPARRPMENGGVFKNIQSSQQKDLQKLFSKKGYSHIQYSNLYFKDTNCFNSSGGWPGFWHCSGALWRERWQEILCRLSRKKGWRHVFFFGKQLKFRKTTRGSLKSHPKKRKGDDMKVSSKKSATKTKGVFLFL